MAKFLLKFFLSGKISPNLVTLIARPQWVSQLNQSLIEWSFFFQIREMMSDPLLSNYTVIILVFLRFSNRIIASPNYVNFVNPKKIISL